MHTVPDLPEFIWLNIIANLDDETVARMAQDPLVGGHHEARRVLFTRSTPSALAYQYRFLGAWLSYFATAKKLSFIKTNADKHEWLKILDGTLRNPLASLEHKIRCCLLINKFFPDSHDITPFITQHLLSAVPDKEPVVSDMKVFISEFSQADIQGVITSLSGQLNDENWGVREKAITALAAIAPCVSQLECDKMVAPLLSRLGGGDLDVRRAAAAALGAIAPRVSQVECDSMVAPLLSGLGDADWSVRRAAATALGAIAPFVSEAKRDSMVTPLLSGLGDADWCVRYAAVAALGAIAPFVSQVERDKMVTPLLRRLVDGDSDVRRAAATALCAIAPFMSEVERDSMVAPLLSRLGDEDWRVRRAAAQSMAVLIPTCSDAQLKTMIELPGEKDMARLMVGLIAQTRLHMNNPEWKPVRDYGVFFSRIEGGMVSQRCFDKKSQAGDEPRTFRLWSIAGDTPRAADDCMTKVSQQSKRNALVG